MIPKEAHSPHEIPKEPGWYKCWATDDRWMGDFAYRAWGNGMWWTPLVDGWISAPFGIYHWIGPVADVNGPSPDGMNPKVTPQGENMAIDSVLDNIKTYQEEVL